MTSPELETFCTELNGGASIGDTVLYQLLNLARALVEQRRPWTVLRTTDTSKTVSAGATWQTAVDLSTITNFNRFYGDNPVKLFDGANRIEYFTPVPLHTRLENRERTNTFVYNENTKQLYFNGTLTYGGTLWIDHVIENSTIDALTSWQLFPDWSHPLICFLAVAMHKGSVDYDEINFAQMGEQGKAATNILRALETWDDNKQASLVEQYDPYQDRSEYRSGAININ